MRRSSSRSDRASTSRAAAPPHRLSRRLTRTVSVSGAYQLQHTQAARRTARSGRSAADRPLSSRSSGSRRFRCRGLHDTRDEPVDSTRGEYAQRQRPAGGAADRIGRSASSSRSSPRRCSARCRMAGDRVRGQARLGIATGFPRDVQTVVPMGRSSSASSRTCPKPERFFAGGDTTVRGFALDTLGRPDTINGRLSDWRERGNHLQRRAARRRCAGGFRVSASSTPATCSPTRPTSISARCGPRSVRRPLQVAGRADPVRHRFQGQSPSRASGPRPGSSRSDRRSEGFLKCEMQIAKC